MARAVHSPVGRLALGLLLISLCGLWAGCPAEEPGTDGGVPDAPLDAPDGPNHRHDAAAGGLVIQLSPSPDLPDVARGVVINEAHFFLRDFRVIGDSASGDSRTTISQLDIQYHRDEVVAVIFPLAPPGVYSQIAARLGQAHGGDSFELRGSVVINGHLCELDVHDQGTANVRVALGGLRLEAGALVIPIKIDLSFLGDIDWAAAPHTGDRLLLGGNDEVSNAIRAGMAAAFSVR